MLTGGTTAPASTDVTPTITDVTPTIITTIPIVVMATAVLAGACHTSPLVMLVAVAGFIAALYPPAAVTGGTATTRALDSAYDPSNVGVTRPHDELAMGQSAKVSG